MASCICANISNFKHKGVKMFPLNLKLECRNLMKKLEGSSMISATNRLNFHEVECTPTPFTGRIQALKSPNLLALKLL